MTSSVTRPVTRETGVLYRHVPLVVTLGARTIQVREKGRRDPVEVSVDAVYEFGLKLRARAEAADKRGRRRFAL